MPPRHVALWGMLACKLVGSWGLTWDIQWHLTIGRDSFWIAPHLMMYSGVTLGVFLAFGVLALETLRARRARPPGTITVFGVTGTRGFHLAAWGLALVVLAAPIDDLWHRLFGLDVTLWSPPHLLGLFGTVVNTFGCLMIAVELYGARGAARVTALLLGGALLYGGTRVVLEPAWLVAYTHGGVAFHTFAIMGAFTLTLGLVTTTRLLARRWAPLAVVTVALAIGLVGDQIARVGFAILQPESVIGEAIRQDPTSPVALGAAIREKNRGAPGPLWMRLLLPLACAAVLTALDVRRRAAVACVAYAIALLALYGWYVGRSPAFAPLVPSAAETAIAIGLAALAALAGGALGRKLGEALAPLPAAPRAAALATSPAR